MVLIDYCQKQCPYEPQSMLEVLLINLVMSNFPPFNEPEHSEGSGRMVSSRFLVVGGPLGLFPLGSVLATPFCNENFPLQSPGSP